MRRNLLTPTGTTRRRTPGSLGGLALVVALALTACSGTQDQEGPDDAAVTSGADAATTTAEDGTAADGADATVDPDSLPDPVAEVNGEEITREDFLQVYEQQLEASQQQAQAGGAPVDEAVLRDGVLASLVSSALLTQEGERLGLDADEEEIDAELESLAGQNGLGSGDELVAALGEQGLDEDQVREEVSRLLLVEEIIDEQGQVEPPTDEELRAYYDELTGGADSATATGDPESGVPAFDDVKGQLAEQLTQERENEALTTILEDLEQDAEITRHL
ncbi:MAG TPA: SurA N-terminal domain-containing protein [Ornithinimicrobium sp.]|nr:SurA N-terminal domain-containing protein [Ornithinimicrobium sp.]